MEQRLVVGLGNPGKRYEMTRHNMGFLFIKALIEKYGWSFKRGERFLGAFVKGWVRQVCVHLLMPTTYMNESGKSVRKYCDFFKIEPQQVIVVSDDISLDFGRMRLRERGSSGGHNGLKSIELHLSTDRYCRLRLGVGSDKRKDLSDFVLEDFSKDEKERLQSFFSKAVEIVDRWFDEDIFLLMNEANGSV